MVSGSRASRQACTATRSGTTPCDTTGDDGASQLSRRQDRQVEHPGAALHRASGLEVALAWLGGQSQQRIRMSWLSTTSEAAWPGIAGRAGVDQGYWAGKTPATRRSRAGSPGRRFTSKSSSWETPSPVVLMKASLRDQHAKNAKVCSCGGKLQNVAYSCGENAPLATNRRS